MMITKLPKPNSWNILSPKKPAKYEVFKFREAKQEANETLNQFHTSLRKLAQAFALADVDFEVEQQLNHNGRNLLGNTKDSPT